VVAAAIVLAGGLASCSEDPEEAYCEAVREQSGKLDDLAAEVDEPGTDVLGGTLESLRTMGAVAPPELDDEYTTVLNAFEALVDAVADAGIDPAEYDRKETLGELDPADARRLRQSAASLGSARVADASLGIEDHAEQVCGVDIGV
jgi:hypothetical protein